MLCWLVTSAVLEQAVQRWVLTAWLILVLHCDSQWDVSRMLLEVSIMYKCECPQLGSFWYSNGDVNRVSVGRQLAPKS